jgi:hypothetical protein
MTAVNLAFLRNEAQIRPAAARTPIGGNIPLRGLFTFFLIGAFA